MIKTILLATTFACALAGSVFAAETAPADATKATPATTTATMPTTVAAAPLFHVATPGERQASRLVGATVYSSAGEKVGDVNDLLVDAAGKVSGVVVGVGGFLGVGEKSVALSWNAVTVGAEPNGKPRLSAAVTKDMLQKAPAFEPAKG